jgi:MoxR-like ATPase
LRRCIYHHITYPTQEQLKQILISNFEKYDESLLQKTVSVFSLIRKEMEQKLTAADKKVSTSELIDWYKVINKYYYAGLQIGELSVSDALDKSLADLKQNHRAKIPFTQVLFKNWEAHMQIMEKF